MPIAGVIAHFYRQSLLIYNLIREIFFASRLFENGQGLSGGFPPREFANLLFAFFRQSISQLYVIKEQMQSCPDSGHVRRIDKVTGSADYLGH
jgi:hypothetical protein